ncbi:MAG: PAS domain S-box protein [Woeseiaceae bacterium]|nr:PAS domain S-box protein [Woeseiaceae bacterium]
MVQIAMSDRSELADVADREFRNIVDALDYGLVILDHQMKCRYINDAAARQLGCSTEASNGETIWEICTNVQDQRHLRDALQCLMNGGPSGDLASHRIYSDQRLDIRISPSRDGWCLSIRDVSEYGRKLLDYENIAAAFTHAADPILILNLNGTVTTINDAALDTYRCARETVVGQSIKTLVPQDLHSETDALLERCRQGEQLVNVDTRRRRRNGEVFPVLTTLSPVVDETGVSRAIIVTTKDITKLRDAANSLLTDRLKLARDARLISLGEMAAGLAHELNQPLSAISYYCDAALSVAQSAPVVDAELVDILHESYDQCQRAGDVLRSIRELAARRQMPRQPEDLNALVSSTIRFLMPEIRSKHIDYRLSLADPPPIVVVDRIEIQQVITNLILNGIEAMDDAHCKLRNLFICTAIVEGEAHISVQDTGPGIKADIAKKLLEPFLTDKEKGLGMGLWISRSILEAHDGRLWTENRTEGGATFCIALPLSAQ